MFLTVLNHIKKRLGSDLIDAANTIYPFHGMKFADKLFVFFFA